MDELTVNRTIPTILLSSLLTTAAGCGDDASDETSAAQTDTEPASETSMTTDDPTAAGTSGSSTSSADEDSEAGSSESEGGPDLAMLYECEDSGFMEFGPLVGPGFDPKSGWLEPLQDSYIAHSTQILVHPDQMDAFFEVSGAVQAQLAETPGLVAVAFAAEPTCGFVRTLGIWRSDKDMYTFVGTGAHAEAMARTLELSVTGKTVSWEISAEGGPPTWASAFDELGAVEPSGVY